MTDQETKPEAITAHVGFGVFDRQGREFGVLVTFTRHSTYVEVHVQRTRNGQAHGRSRAPFVVDSLEDAQFKSRLRVDTERYSAQKQGVPAAPAKPRLGA